MSGLFCSWYKECIPGREIVALGVVIALYNVIIRYVAYPYLRHHNVINANLQISLDWVALTLLMHLTGGMHSPFLLFFFFHVIIAAILIPGLGSYWHAMIATVVVAATGFLESIGAIEHLGPVWASLQPQPAGHHLLIAVGFFGFSMFVCAFLASTIVAHLRQVEREQAELQQELADANAKLEAANKELIEMDEQKSRYTRTVTHQLRSPLSTIQSMLRVLLDGYGGSLDERVLQIIERSEQRILKLLDTVSDLLDLAGLDFEAKPRQSELVAMEPLIAAIILKYQPMADARKISLEATIPEELTVRAAPDDMELALDNLISNGIKYAMPSGAVRVRGWCAENMVHISVEDNGIGIPEEAQQDLFQEFFRAPNAKLFEPIGTGLGLVIVKRSVERWGGTISVMSEIDRGTTFTLHFAQPGRQ